MKKLAVLSRFREVSSHFKDIVSESGYDTLVFEKHDQGENSLPNVGRESHTFLHYIIENYNNLPDEILFSQYDPMDHFRGRKGSDVRQNISDFLNKNLIDYVGIRPTDFDLIVRRRHINWIKFSEELFGKFDDRDVDKLLSCGSTLNGVFRASRESILKHDIDLYRKGLEMLSRGGHDPEEGFFFERIWKFLFMGLGCENANYKNIEEKIFRFGTNNLEKQVLPKTVHWKLDSYGHIKLSYDGTIRSNGNVSFYHHFNESHWLVRNDTLYFLDSCGAGTSKYNLGDNNYQNYINKSIQTIQGDFASNQNKWNEGSAFLTAPFWRF